MCFSAQASFIAAAGLIFLGLLLLKKTQKTAFSLFVLIPLCFGFQQMAEGMVWVTLNRSDTVSFVHKSAVYSFLSFAYVLWPLIISGLLYWFEEQQKRKMLLFFCFCCGAIVAFSSMIAFFVYNVRAEISHHHIKYLLVDASFLAGVRGIYIEYAGILFYVVATIGALFVSSIRKMWILGILVAFSFIFSYIYYYMEFGSIWCFFSAIESCVLYYIVSDYMIFMPPSIIQKRATELIKKE